MCACNEVNTNNFSQCVPWAKRSCCTKEVTEDIHSDDNMYNFNFNHCHKKMSDECRKHFTQDHCFYECSPNVGPWVVFVSIGALLCTSAYIR